VAHLPKSFCRLRRQTALLLCSLNLEPRSEEPSYTAATASTSHRLRMTGIAVRCGVSLQNRISERTHLILAADLPLQQVQNTAISITSSASALTLLTMNHRERKAMTLATVACRAQVGLHAPLVQVEVSLGAGLPTFSIVGLPATVVRESKERVRAALTNSNFEFPVGHITVNLAPADLPKEGGRFDLPIALGILLASGQISGSPNPTPAEYYGELGLGGELRPVRGLLLAAVNAAQLGHEIIVPRGNTEEALLVCRTPVRAADHLLEVCNHLAGTITLPNCNLGGSQQLRRFQAQSSSLDLSDVRGQLHAKRALVIAAAGGHSVLMIGPPGSGKSMLAQRLPGLLTALTTAEALEVASIASVSAMGFDESSFGRRPFRAPHHTASAPALVGGGSRARPGEASLAHHGVLFLDELPEFPRASLEALREPLESGVVSVSRAAMQARYPAAFQLVAAMNPCPCGYEGDPSSNCNCTPAEVQRYRAKISGPLLDRIDMHVEVPRVEVDEFDEAVDRGESTSSAAARIVRARQVQLTRQGICNAGLADSQIERWCCPDRAGRNILDRYMKRLGLSARSRGRVLKLARTIADLDEDEIISASHVSQAIMLRCLDRTRTQGAAALT
jgi:magnesium chelatase family protein